MSDTWVPPVQSKALDMRKDVAALGWQMVEAAVGLGITRSTHISGESKFVVYVVYRGFHQVPARCQATDSRMSSNHKKNFMLPSGPSSQREVYGALGNFATVRRET